MNSKLKLTLKSITHSGSHIGRDITLQVASSELSFDFETKKNVLPDKTTLINKELYNLEVKTSKLDIPLAVTVIERDVLFNDKGSIYKRLYINTDVASVSEHIVTVKVYENRLFFWKKPAKFDVLFEVGVIQDKDVPSEVKTLKQYTYKGIGGTEDYNQHDDVILKAVAYWNKEFAGDTSPPEMPLDPNLVKAILYQETRIGNDPRNHGLTNIMQVGNDGDPSFPALRGEQKEYWIHNAELIALNYGAKNNSPYNSVFWGVRWLYHKAQYIKEGDNKRYWRTWKEAVAGYGPPEPEYIDNVWSIYTGGIDTRSGKPVKLWILSLIMVLLAGGLFTSNFLWSDLSIENQTMVPVSVVVSPDNTEKEVVKSDDDPTLFAQILVKDKDWWESLTIGRVVSGHTKWLDLTEVPTEQSIHSVNFFSMGGKGRVFLEVYGITHMGHGNYYLYAVEEDTLRLVLKTAALDINRDTRFQPEYMDLYGYSHCGEVFVDDILKSQFEDKNNDEYQDVVLSGSQLISCEDLISVDEHNYITTKTVEVAHIPVEKNFLWDAEKQLFN